MSGSVAIGNTIVLDKPTTDLSGVEREAGQKLVVEQAAHEHTSHPIVMATPVDRTRHAVTHRTLHGIQIGGEYCFYLDDLRKAVDGVPF
jgi:hypothetical protein